MGVPAQAQVQLATSYYVPWTRELVSPEGSQLHLRVSFDKTTMQTGDAVSCTVEAERVGFRGYGMMLAEIGLPPGAEVERQFLDASMTASGYALGSYDILPDRVVAYVWPSAGGTKFKFRFRPRFAVHAKSAPSLLYDYYNPDARVVVTPVNFSVQSAAGEATSAGN